MELSTVVVFFLFVQYSLIRYEFKDYTQLAYFRYCVELHISHIRSRKTNFTWQLIFFISRAVMSYTNGDHFSAAQRLLVTQIMHFLSLTILEFFPPPRNLLVNLGLFAAGVWVARNLSDFDLMSPQPVT